MDKQSFIQSIKSYLIQNPKASITSAISALGIGAAYNKLKGDKTLQKYLGDLKKTQQQKKIDTKGSIRDAIDDAFMR